MQDVEQGEPQSQVLFRVTFLQCITLARQTLHHKSATYQQRHHEAARLPDPPARGPAPGSARPPPGSLRRIRTGEPAATGVGRRGRDRPGGDERHAGRRRSGERNHPRRAPPEPPPGRRRGERDHARRGRSGQTTGGGRRGGGALRAPNRFRPDDRGRPGPDPLERHGASVRCRRRGHRRSPRPGPRADIPGQTGRGSASPPAQRPWLSPEDSSPRARGAGSDSCAHAPKRVLVPAGAGCWTVRRPGPRGAGEHVFSELEWPVTTETGAPRSAPSAGPGGVQENLDDIGPVY